MAFITLNINNVEDAIRAKAMLEAYIQMEMTLGDNNSEAEKMLSIKPEVEDIKKVVEPQIIKETTNKDSIKPKVVEGNNEKETTNKDTKNIEFEDIQHLAKSIVKLANDNEEQRIIRYWLAKINIEIGNNKSAKIRNLDKKYYKLVHNYMLVLGKIINGEIMNDGKTLTLEDVTIDKLKENL